MIRRSFIATVAIMGWPAMATARQWAGQTALTEAELRRIERPRVLANADRCLSEAPLTLSSTSSPRSPGGPNDYYSEADYWWPNPADPEGPYIRRDGYSNPDKFTGHRDLLIRLGLHVPALVAAWKLTGEARYRRHAEAHLHAWFVSPETRMSPHLEYAQAILGVNTGRGIGVIDTLHLVEVAQAAILLKASGFSAWPEAAAVTAWFDAYLTWMTTSSKGQDERDEENNHGTCWLLQAAVFARLAVRSEILASARDRFRDVIVPGQLARDGSQPLELARTKPYGYSLFNLEVLATLAWTLSDRSVDLWRHATADGRGMAGAIAFMTPFIADKGRWPHPPDVEYFDDQPVRQISLLFAGLVYGRPDLIALWHRLKPDPGVAEIVRNNPIRQPLLWTTDRADLVS